MKMKIACLVLFFPSICFAIGDCRGNPSALDESYAPNSPDHRNVFFGEQHIHTSNSADAYSSENRMGLEDTYDYAMGCHVEIPGVDVDTTVVGTIRKRTRYDWVAITDHAEYLGILGEHSTATVTEVIDSLKSGVPDPEYTSEMIRDAWKEELKIIEDYNTPHKFTTLVAYEWTSIPNSQNLHRNVFFRGKQVDGCTVGEYPDFHCIAPEAPFSAFDSQDPEDLWTYLEIQRMAGYDNFAIAHNGNVSDGRLYSDKRYNGLPIDERYVQRRFNNEPLTEILQAKGQSDTHPSLSPNDEFADFEMYTKLIDTPFVSNIQGGYIRQALAQGLKHEENLGVNPFKFGIVSGADSHSGFSDNEEDNYYGTHGKLDDTVEERLAPATTDFDMPSVFGTPGATGVWAEANTRDEIFDAMQRKETYGTSGPLIQLRFFGGWDYPDDLFEDGHQHFLDTAYGQGVPMGGNLVNNRVFLPEPGEGAIRAIKAEVQGGPTFAVWAHKDLNSGDLDRIQIIKVWVEDGRSKEKIYEVAWGGDRVLDDDGKLPPLTSTVDVENASYDNGVGAISLHDIWRDDDFDPLQRVAYYARVLEIQTPRWSTYDAADPKNTAHIPIPPGVPHTVQERAWSSPIWYTPPEKVIIIDPGFSVDPGFPSGRG